MYKRKIITAILIIMILTVAMTSCSVNASIDKEVPINIYHPPYDILSREAADIYNSIYESDINASIFSDMNVYYEQVLIELLSGKGPDVILVDPLFIGVESLIESDILMDINELIDNDRDFDLSLYNEKVVNGMLRENKRYLIPVSYTINAFVTTGNNPVVRSIPADANSISITTLEEIAQSYDENNLEGYILDSSLSFTDMLKNMGIDSYFFCSNEVFDDKVFTDALLLYKTLYGVMYNGNDTKSQLILDNKAAFVNMEDITNPDELLKDYSQNVYGNEELHLYNITLEEGGGYAVPRILVGINKNTQNPQGALDFIKILLDKEIQSMDSFMYTPVNKEAYEDKLKRYRDNRNTNNLVEAVLDLEDAIKGSSYLDIDIERIINEGVRLFLGEEKSLEETVASIIESIQKNHNERITTKKGIQASEETMEKSESDGEKKILKMYMHDFTREAINAVQKFNLVSSEVEIDLEVTSNREEFPNKFTTSIIAGDGPDIIVSMDYFIPSIHNMIRNGVFLDMNPLIENDRDFDLSDYHDPVLDAGVYDGRRYYIPYRYTISALATSREILEENNIQIDDDKWTWDKVLEIVDQLKNYNRDEKKYLFSRLDFYDLIISAEPFIDYEERTSRYNTEEFIELLKIYNEIYPFIWPPEDLERYYSSSIGDDLPPPEQVIFQRFSANMNYLTLHNSIYTILANQSMNPYIMPSVNEGNQTFATVNEFIGINAGCEYGEDAFDYIKMFLDEFITDKYYHSLPVSKKTYEEFKNYFSTNSLSGSLWINGERRDGPTIPEPLVHKMDSWVENISSCIIIDRTVKEIIDEEVDSFIRGQKTAEEAARIIDQKVNIFLNE